MEGSAPSHIKSEGLLKMNSAIRYFALTVALAGLAFASFPSAMSQARTSRPSTSLNSALPGPLPCTFNGACYAPVRAQQ